MTYLEALTEAASNKGFVSNYDRLTKSNFGKVISATGIEKLIDQSTGHAKEEVAKFMDFFNEFVWNRLPQESFKNSINN